MFTREVTGKTKTQRMEKVLGDTAPEFNQQFYFRPVLGTIADSS